MTLNLTEQGWLLDGEPTSKCSWDIETRTAKVLEDLNVPVVIKTNNILLKGNHHKIIGDGLGTGLQFINSDHIYMDDLSVSDFYQGIVMNKCSDIIMQSCNVSNNFYGIKINNGNGHFISYCNVNRNEGYGMLLKDCSNMSISNNMFFDNVMTNIYLENCNNHMMLENFLGLSQVGLEVRNSRHNAIMNNHIKDNNIAVYICHESVDNTILSNDISDSKLFAVGAIDDVGDNNINHNKISNCSNGVLLANNKELNIILDNDIDVDSFSLIHADSENIEFSNNRIKTPTEPSVLTIDKDKENDIKKDKDLVETLLAKIYN